MNLPPSNISMGQPSGTRDSQGRKQGVWNSEYANGARCEEITYLDDVMDGPTTRWNPDGTLSLTAHFRQGKKWGELREYLNGQLIFEGSFVDDTPHGMQRIYGVTSDNQVVLAEERPYHLGRPNGVWKSRVAHDAPFEEHRFSFGVPVDHGFKFLGILQGSMLSRLSVLLLIVVMARILFRDSAAANGFIVLSLAIVIHEFGHWLAARFCGIPIMEFRVGVGPQLLSFRLWQSLWHLHLLPLMGWVREPLLLPGELQQFRDSKRSTNQAVVDQFKFEDETSFNTMQSLAFAPSSTYMHPGRRLLFQAGGVLANFLTAFLIFWITLTPTRPDKAAVRTVGIATRIVSIVPMALVEQLRPANYVNDTEGILRGMRDAAKKRGQTIPQQLAIISVVLAVLNLMPIPPLDGFQLTLTLIESIRGKPLPPTMLLPLRYAGIGFLMLLTISGVFLIGRDLIQMLLGK